jgi:hypothetical protein
LQNLISTQCEAFHRVEHAGLSNKLFKLQPTISLGYGDIYPIGWGSQLLVIVQLIIAWGYNAM